MKIARPAVVDSRSDQTSTPRRIVMLIYPGIAPLDVAGPLQVFGFANLLMKQRLYEVWTVAPTTDPVLTEVGFSMLPACAMIDVPLPIDTLLVSGGGGPDTVTDPAVFRWLRKMSQLVQRLGSICTGIFVLADSGMIDGKRVTTHWALGAELARRHPTAHLDTDAIFVRDGKLYSSGGTSAGIDLALAMLEEDHGRDLALKVARYLVLYLIRPGGQRQFSMQLQAQFSSIPAIQQVRQWCIENLGGDLRVVALAKRAGMSERSFIRAFREDTDTTPADFVRLARLHEARRLLEETTLAPRLIAKHCGIGSLAAMRRLFLQEIGVTPLEYRERFHGEAASAAPPR
jgi:transcriptional regulator GlxA family with amidase domain